MGVYNYKVLREVDPSEISIDDSHPLREFPLLQLIGEFKAKEPDLAALDAANQLGKAGTYHPIPERNYNDTPIVPTTGFKIGEPGEDEPPPPPLGDGELSPGLDPDACCEWSEDGQHCGHRPHQHGARGLGICRVEGCPCGKAKYPEIEP